MAFQGDSIFWVEVEKIVPNPYQPRREFDEARLKELSESVRMYGILQPLTVTRKEVQNSDGSFRSEYELIAGERRLRASKLAGLTQVPVIIRDGEQTEQEKLELAIIENLQREDLNAVDRALAFRQLADVFGLSHVQVAAKVGRSREYVSNSIRILALPDYMLSSLRTGDISEGHARTLLMLNDRPEEQDTVFREILLKKLSVREVERIARGIAVEKTRRKDNIDTDLLEFERKFTETLGTRVSIVKTEFGGKLTIDYFSIEDLEGMLVRMKDEVKAQARLTTGTPAPMTFAETEPPAEALNALEFATPLEVVPSTPAPISAPVPALTSLSEVVDESDPFPEYVPVHKEVEAFVETNVVTQASVPVVGPDMVTEDTEVPVVTEMVVEPVVAQVEPAPVPVHVVPAPAPVMAATPGTPANNVHAGRLSLRDQLASLFAAPAATTEVVATQVAVTSSTEEPAPQPVPPKVDTDVDLYDIKNFSV
jgi:ParB family transcriptional regulator, chromosome partitioning protein